jgi:NIPSNAP
MVQDRTFDDQRRLRELKSWIRRVRFAPGHHQNHAGRVDAHVNRFREHTCRLLEKHGITVVGCWVTATDEHTDQVVFITAHESLDAMRTAQRAFAADPEQNAMVRDSEKDGPIIHHSDNWYLQPTDFSPLK